MVSNPRQQFSDKRLLKIVGGIAIFTAIIFISYLIVVSGIIVDWSARGGAWWLGLTFIAGLLYTTFSTIPIATAIFVSLGHTTLPIGWTALIGGLGAVLGDAGLFSAIRMSILDIAGEYLARKTHGYFAKTMHRPVVRLLAIVVGGLVVASPLPDELGMAIMGMTQIRTRYILLLSYLFNVASIAGILYLVR